MRPVIDGASPPGGSGAQTLVLACSHFESSPGFGGLAARLPDGADLEVVDELCRNPGAIGERTAAAASAHLVLAVCREASSTFEVQSHVRRAGLDPFGVPVVDLGGPGRGGLDPEEAVAVMAAVLHGAVARARAFPGAGTANARVVLASGGTAVSRRGLFTLPPVVYRTTPTIDRGLCAAPSGCDRCVAACPHDALSVEGDSIIVERSGCESCGLCVDACPHRAVRFPGYSAGELEAELSAALDPGVAPPDAAIAFTCMSYPEPLDGRWLPVTTACAGMAPVAAMLRALSLGATEVGVRPCAEGCANGCDASIRGRVDYCQELLAALGDSPSRVRLLSAEAQDPARAARPLPPLPGARTGGAVALFGRGAAAAAIEDIAARFDAGAPVIIEHPESPVGIVDINADACTACGTCAVACPTDALAVETSEDAWSLLFDHALCTACGECQRLCPEQAAGAISFRAVTDMSALRAGPGVAMTTEEVRCERCGQGFATRRMLERLAEMLGDDYDPELMGSLCSECRGTVFQ